MTLKPFTILVPCYNEEGAIKETVSGICESIGSEIDFELLVIDDGSTDQSTTILTELEKTNTKLKVLRHPQNRGYGAALKSGVRYAKTDLIVITDADGTYPNHRIPELVKLCEDHDMVVGSRTGSDVTYSKIRAIPKLFLRSWASWIARHPIPDINSGLRVFRRDLATKFAGILPDGFSFTTTITLAMLTNFHRVHYEPISYKVRVGNSKIQPIRDTLRFTILILRTGTYFAPMRVFSPFVLLLLLMACGSLVYDVLELKNLTDKTVLLFLFTLNMGMFALLADMIDKRSR